MSIQSNIKTILATAKIGLQQLVGSAETQKDIDTILRHINKLNKYIVVIEQDLIGWCCFDNTPIAPQVSPVSQVLQVPQEVGGTPLASARSVAYPIAYNAKL